MSDVNEQQPPLEIPREALSDEAFTGIMDNFIQREGTDYGLVEIAYEKKVEKLKRQIESGDVKIVFDPNTETVTLMTARDWKKFSHQ